MRATMSPKTKIRVSLTPDTIRRDKQAPTAENRGNPESDKESLFAVPSKPQENREEKRKARGNAAGDSGAVSL